MTPEEEKAVFEEENPNTLCNLEQFDKDSLQGWFEDFFLTKLPNSIPLSPVMKSLQDQGNLSEKLSHLDLLQPLVDEDALRRKYQHILRSKKVELMISDNKAYLIFDSGFKTLVS